MPKGNPGIPKSPEHRAKIGAAQKGVARPHMVGRKLTEEHKQKIADAQRGLPKVPRTYLSFHRQVMRLRGTPSVCWICQSTTENKYHWANINGNFADINDYIRLCAKCHRRYDMARRTGRASAWITQP